MNCAKVAMLLGLIVAWTCSAAQAQIDYPEWWDAAEYQASGMTSYNSSLPDGLTEEVFLENAGAPPSGYIETAIELDYTWTGWPVPGPDPFGCLGTDCGYVLFLAPQDYSQPFGTPPFDEFEPDTSQDVGGAGWATRLFTYTFGDVPPWEGSRFHFTGDWGPLGGSVTIHYDLRAHHNQPGCVGDLDGDGDTDQGDLGVLLADWGCDDPVNGCVGDLDGDDDTDQADLGILLTDWGCGT